jgi:hypothetical protein
MRPIAICQARNSMNLPVSAKGKISQQARPRELAWVLRHVSARRFSGMAIKDGLAYAR